MVNATANNDTNALKVYGVPAESGRWVFVLAGMVMNLCLGTVYAWSVFRKPLQELFSTPEVKITATQTLLPFMLFLAVFTVLMPISGRLLQRGVSPSLLSIVGSVLVAAGWILSGYATNLYFLYLTYGVIAGAGVGIVYGIPIAVVTRWFPDIKGIAVGATVLGFGASALVTAYVASNLIAAQGILTAFRSLGLFFLVWLVLLSLLLKFPPLGWKPAGWQPAAGMRHRRLYPWRDGRDVVRLGLMVMFYHRFRGRIDGHRHLQWCRAGNYQSGCQDGGRPGCVLCHV